ncbi:MULTISPECIES: flagellar assembly protein T N-terminal domain-containing protein [unclassified Agarivorans]|uniref:flagellar assembly protein T N-terminal domain-containing protein n=1 Tax=unclassified Agarivorans TaxID=2636026 RepID=UPI0026E1AC4B|nr:MULTISPECIES: flagellar assembly protein T N-terminal domain-containing protein [unclassified Agarivorans]MDO6687824.1 flagellar assembly protein T N-terminal domain-containing protein [Agarivorans sp. 3_MG-2023]MDO6717446.1 flagellar assembly protein T N-terminal domain-containing protein [Agarivorans sp. 2_MG-2023]
MSLFIRAFCLWVMLAGVNAPSYAVWFEGEGQAKIVDGQVDKARQQAIQDALLTLMYRGGASVKSLQIVKSGVLETDELTVRTNGEVYDMKLLVETIEDDQMTVTVAADIFPLNTCEKDSYAKTLFVGPFQLQKREHAQLGGIYRTPEEVSQRLFHRFKLKSKRVDARHLMTRQIAFDGRYANDIEPQMLKVARSLSSQYDVQYILFGKINDMSSYNETSTNLLGMKSTVKQRNFQVKLYVIDGINGETILRKSYGSNREWPFDVTMKLDVTGQTFWSSDYGNLIDSYIDQAVVDVEDALYCRQSLATVVGLYNGQVVINIGQTNGVRKGDKFELVRQQYLMHLDGGLRGPIFNADDTQLTVMSVQSDRAVLATKRFSDMANIQIRDVLVAVDNDPFAITDSSQ